MSGKGLGLAAMIARPVAPEKRAVEEEEKRVAAPLPQRESIAAPVVHATNVYDEQEDSAVAARVEAAPANRITRSSSPHPRTPALPQPRKPGRPPREGGVVKRTISLAPSIDEYMEEAWRTYRNPQGNRVKGASGFIEGLIEAYRRKHPIDLE